MKVTPQFVAAGEILIDFISKEPTKTLNESQNFGKFFGGAPANVAVNMQRLGIPSAIVSRVGSDGLGTFLIDYLQKLGIDTAYITRDPEWPTSMVVLTSGTATAEFVAYRQADTRLERSDIPSQLILDADIFHTTAHGIAKNPTREAILDAFILASEKGKITSFDPNYSRSFWPDREDAMRTLAKFFAHTVFCKPSLDDCERIFGKKPEEDYLRILRDHGVRNVILTRGERGAVFSSDRGEMRQYPAQKVENIVDPTGAGDAFTAGFFAAYLRTNSIDMSINVATRVAAFSLSYLGAVTPLPPIQTFFLM